MENNYQLVNEYSPELELQLLRSESSDSEDSNASKNLSIAEPKESEPQHFFADSNTENLQSRLESAIYAVLSSVFENKRVNDLHVRCLNSDAQFYLTEVLKKKFVFEPGFQNLALKKARRRTEEQFKFVIKKGFKRLFKEFKKMRNGFVRGNKLLDEFEFYRFYFGGCVDEANESLETFFLPGSKIQKEMKRPEIKINKTISFAFLQTIFRSEAFKQDFIRYLLNGFVDEYISRRTEKLWKVASNFALQKKSKSNKLPWTNEELLESQRNLLNLILSSLN